MKKQLNLVLLLLSLSLLAFSQQGKKALNHDDILKWNRITETILSNDGQTIVYKTEPWKGDPELKITNPSAEEFLAVTGGNSAKITANSDFVLFTIDPLEADIHALKLKKTKKEDMPLPELGIYSVLNKKLDKIDKLKSFKSTTKGLSFVAYQVEAEKDSSKKEKGKKASTALELQVKNLKNNELKNFPAVNEYFFDEEGNALFFVSEAKEKDFEAGLYRLDLASNQVDKLFDGKADFKQVTANKSGTKLAFLVDTNSNKKADKNYKLFSWNSGQEKAEMIVDNSNNALPELWELSGNGRISFAPKTNRIFFGIAPVKAKPDTTILAEDIPDLDIWHWNEDVLQTEQINRKKRDLNKSYMAVYHPDKQKVVQIENTNFSGIRLIKKGDDDEAFAWSNKPYAVQTMYEGSPAHNDFYLVDLNTGKAKQIVKDCRATPQVSPEGNYLFWFTPVDTSWNTYKLSNNKFYKISTPKTIQVADEENDIPNPPRSYNIAAWSEDDDEILIYDRYDIWKVDPENKKESVNLTVDGRSSKTNYRLIRFDLDGVSMRERYSQANEKGINIKEKVILTGHNEVSRQDGYYAASLDKAKKPKALIVEDYSLNSPIKAKDADQILFTKENFETFPNLLVSDLKFKKVKQITDANPQQKDFNWGSAELVTWFSLDGKKLEGTLHKPADFDPNKKYPMIVNFYEKNSQGLFNYRMPEPHRSTIDYHYYTSNGYVVFNPDIYYKTGYPGEDAFNCVMPGVMAMISKGFIDEKHIGAQGHSWGGYQVAYLATRTNLFAAIESGAPVVNMFSAYGGIRWGSGMNRSFQYEHTQSRIGKSIWESPLRYIENSPLFTMDKVQTPILIMHNDDDGSVPWYQGIEYFIALRRLGKPAWLLNYNQADHWPLKIRDKHDFQIRLAQFFDHYLKGKPMPKWMDEGIPAVDKGFEMGYDLVK